MQVLDTDGRDHIEVCPAAGQTVQEVAKRIEQHGGFSLFIDYGHSGEKGDTFRVSIGLGDKKLELKNKPYTVY
jgi:SAM-dependent MidA family methyltransferase